MAVDPIEPPPQHRFTTAGGKQMLVVDLPMIDSLAGVELDIGQTEIRLCLPGSVKTSIPLPKSIISDPESNPAAAKFSRKRGQLTISWSLAEVSMQAPEVTDRQPQLEVGAILPNPADPAAAESSTLESAVFAEEESREAQPQPVVDGAASKQAKPAGAYGSLWNANNWHWEEKNCIEMLRHEVHRAFDTCASERLKHIGDLSGASVCFKDVSVDGEASFTLRRGKRILCYEATAKFSWEVRDAYGSLLGAKGKGNVSELTQDEEDPQVNIEILTSFGGGADAKAAGEWVRRQGARVISRCLAGSCLSAQVIAAEEQRANADEDAARRKAERAKAEAAQTATAAERERLACEQGRMEATRRVQPGEGAVSGSVWNANAWHWEEKPMTAWAQSWLQRQLDGLTLSFLGGLASAVLAETKVSGDASVSVRKGRPISLFQLRIECAWSVTATAAGVGEARGSIIVPEFTSEDGAKGSIEVQASSGGKSSSAQLVAALRREGIPAVRAVLSRFSDELKGQLDRSS